MNPDLLHDSVEKAIAAFVAMHEATHPSMADTARSLCALPLWFDWSGGVAIRPDGELVDFNWDCSQQPSVTTDPHFRFLALVTGAKRHAGLVDLAPKRAPEDRDCPACHGAGVIADVVAAGLDPDEIACYCGGTGWLPVGVPDPPCTQKKTP